MQAGSEIFVAMWLLAQLPKALYEAFFLLRCTVDYKETVKFCKCYKIVSFFAKPIHNTYKWLQQIDQKLIDNL